jgi:hypothetical protein
LTLRCTIIPVDTHGAPMQQTGAPSVANNAKQCLPTTQLGNSGVAKVGRQTLRWGGTCLGEAK